MPRKVTILPSARRLIHSLRDMGYDLSTAVADLIDNSIAAMATEVRIDYEFEGAETWIRIADNGTGMTAAQIDEALRFGTQRDYGETELGKFGLGLKTASLSQCQRFTVASRTADSARLAIRQWDLEHVEKSDAWELLRLSAQECHHEVTKPLARKQGTVIFWERLDRVLGYTVPAGKAAQNGFIRMCEDLELHLAMVFHRFLSGEAKRKGTFDIYLNGNRIEPWDPFARHEAKTQVMRPHRIPFEHENVKSSIRVQPYVLPHESQFSSTQSHKAAGGPKRWLDQQGLYIYRNDRMLQAGGWNRIRGVEEHVKLARISVDFPPSADTAFKINVIKSGIIFPADVREQLVTIVKEVSSRANDVYRKREKKPKSEGVTNRSRETVDSQVPSGHRGAENAESPKTVKESGTTSYTQNMEPGWISTTVSTNRITEPKREPVAHQIVKVITHELEEHPDARRRILAALQNINEEFRDAVRGGHSTT